MASTSVLTNVFKKKALQAYFAGKTIKCAVYAGQTLSASTASYTTSGEVTGAGYTAGGATLSNLTYSADGAATAYADWDDATWATATITGRQALLYDSATGDAILVCTFDADKASTAGLFTVTIPESGSGAVRLS
jgi:hypothetical protein